MRHRLWAAVSTTLTARMTARVTTLSSCVVYLIVPSGIPKLMAFSAAMLLGYAMIIRDHEAFTGGIRAWWQLKGKVSWQSPPAFFTDTAKKMGAKLDKKRPFGVAAVSAIAISSPFKGQVIIGEDLLAMPENELNAVLAHELAHLRPKQVNLLFLLFYAVVVGTSVFARAVPIVTILAGTSIFLIVRTIVSHSMEYDADRIGSGYVPPHDLASALRRLVKPENYDKASETHPSVRNRIARLMAPREPAWVRFSIWIFGLVARGSYNEEFLSSFIADVDERCRGRGHVVKLSILTSELSQAVILSIRHRGGR